MGRALGLRVRPDDQGATQPLAKQGRILECRADRGNAYMKGHAPGARNTTKHQGDITEMLFMIEASNRGFGVAKPIGDNERYDVILDRGMRRFWRVQVKGTGCVHHNGFSVRTCWRTTGKRLPYTEEQIDFFVALYRGERTEGRQLWYVIPARALGGRLGITFYPFGHKADRHPQFEKYREAWGLLGRALPRG